MSDDIINNLREALQHSPENIPLKLHLAETLVQSRRYEEAEKEYKEILSLKNNHLKATSGLANVYFRQEKYSLVIVFLEDILETAGDIPELMVLLSKAYVKDGSIHQAVPYYKKALQLDPSSSDEELDNLLRNPTGEPQPPKDEIDEILDEDALKMLEKPSLSFKDVGGMDKIKQEIDLKIIKPLKHPELYEAYGKKVGGGILLYGPPGCGKTYLARATAGEINASFISVGINDILDMWMGNSERNLHEIFETARRNTPCVLFFDEVDALGASRTDLKQSSGRRLINQFLAELDGVDSNNDGVLILGATNAPWHLDTAFRRPGRFDRIIFVSPPDEISRESILKIQLEKKPTKDVDFKGIAKRLHNYSGADIQAVIDIAIEGKLEESFTTGVPQPLSTKDIANAVKKHRPSTGEWFTTAKNYAIYANESGLYDEILTYMKLK